MYPFPSSNSLCQHKNMDRVIPVSRNKSYELRVLIFGPKTNELPLVVLQAHLPVSYSYQTGFDQFGQFFHDKLLYKQWFEGAFFLVITKSICWTCQNKEGLSESSEHCQIIIPHSLEFQKLFSVLIASSLIIIQYHCAEFPFWCIWVLFFWKRFENSRLCHSSMHCKLLM